MNDDESQTKPMTFRDAVAEAIKTGLQIRRADWSIKYPSKFISLFCDRNLRTRYTDRLSSDDILADDWFMVPRDWMDDRGPNEWKGKKS